MHGKKAFLFLLNQIIRDFEGPQLYICKKGHIKEFVEYTNKFICDFFFFHFLRTKAAYNIE